MSDARSDVLARIHRALGAGAAVPEIPRAYRGAGALDSDGVVDRFCERVAEYHATVTRLAAAELLDTVGRLCEARGAKRIAVPPGGPDRLPGVEVVVDDPPLTPQALDKLDGVERSGRRALTLVPDWHVCVVEADAVVAGVPDAIAELSAAAADGRPITFVSGPSATSDIELDRVEGVHGPRTLDVLVVSVD